MNWKAGRETLRLMCGSVGSEQNFLIHPSVLPECTVPPLHASWVEAIICAPRPQNNKAIKAYPRAHMHRDSDLRVGMSAAPGWLTTNPGSISISVARSGHLASQSRVKRPPPRPPARKQPSWRVFFSTLWAPPLAAADPGYGNLTAITNH